MALRILIVSTPVGPVGSGEGGGVELTLNALANGLAARGHDVTAIVPAGSLPVGVRLVQVAGTLQPPMQLERRDAPVVVPPDSVLAAMWDEVRRRQHDVDVVLSLAYDWLPLHLTPFLAVPVAHLVSMASLTDAMDAAVVAAATYRPGSVAMHTRAQGETFPPIPGLRVIGNGIDVDRYPFVAEPDETLGWVGRIAPEKGLVDAVEVAARTGLPLRVWGLLQDPATFAEAVAAHPSAHVTHEGFLPNAEMATGLARCKALLVTPHWVEAFGNVVVESLACGVPVVAYRRGGPAEIVVDGETGFLTPAGDTAAMAEAVGQVSRLSRLDCRRHVEAEFSQAALANRVDGWLRDLVRATATPASS